MKKLIFLIVLAIATPARAGGAGMDKTKLKAIAAKYKEARRLQKNGDYSKARQIYMTLRTELYHPKLDYRIAQCFEGEKDYARAEVFYKSYLKYRSQYKIGKKDPAVDDVQAKIAELEKKNQAPPLATPTPGGGENQPDSTSGGGGGATVATSTSATMTPTSQPGAATTNTSQPGMAPLTAPPPPRPPANRGSAQVYYDPYMEAGPPPLGPVGVRRVFPRFNAFYVTADVAYAYLNGDLEKAGFSNGGAGVGVGLYWRPIPYVSAGLTANILYASPDSKHESVLDPVTFVLAGGEVRGQFPIFGWGYRAWAMEVWGSVGAGFLYAGYRAKDPAYNSELTSKLYGGYGSAAVGFKLFVTPWLSTGVLAKVFRPFYNKSCSKGELSGVAVDACSTDKSVKDQDDTIVYIGISSTAHFYMF